MEKTREDPSAYLASLPGDDGAFMRKMDELVSGAMGEVSRVLWRGVFWGGTEQTIVGYGDLRMTQSRGRVVDWFMVGLALQKNYVSLYVNAVEDRQYVAEKYRDRLGKAKVGKASIGYKKFEDVDVDGLTRILEIAKEQLDAAH